ncbi:MAG: PAS domain S-box protein [Terracidiphilus sp.]|jgi:diguanylate cyclase (GGDEF)-like protein/PAS domain S-box-containing protein
MRDQAEANLAAFIDSTQNLIWAVDLDYRLLTFNRAFQQAFQDGFGIRVEVGMRREGSLPPERAAIFPPLYKRALSEGPFRTDYQLLDGRTVELAFNPIVVDGKTTGILVFGKDITERKTAEKTLLEAEKKYKGIFDGALEGMFQTAPDARFLAANRALAEMLGYDSPDKLISAHTNLTQDLWADREELSELIRQLEEHGSVRGFECRLNRKDGGILWVALSARRICGANGQPLCLEGFIADITERKRAEIQLRDSEDRYRTVFQTGPDPAIIARLSDGMIIDANQAFLDTSGYEPNEVMGRTTLELGIWVNAIDRQNLVDAVLQNTTCRNFEVLSRRKNGEIFWMRLSASLIDIRGDRGLLAFARDISEAKAAEERLAAAAEELRASEERYRATFQMSIDAININRLSDGVFVDVNDAFLDFVGYRREEVIGRTSEDLNFWVDRDARQKMVETLRQNGSCRNLEARFRKKNGEIVWGQLSESLIEAGGVPCILSVTRDISGAKTAEQNLATAQQALRVSEERYRTAFQTSMDAITISGLGDGRYFDVNKAFLDLIGYEYRDVVGRTSAELGIWVHPGTREEMVQMLRQNLSFKDIKTQFIHKSGEIRWVLISASVIEIEGVPCILSVVRDISEAKAAEEKINDLAFYDPLTRLPNRRLLLDRLRHTPSLSARSNRMRALLFVDLDNFKMLNDTLGHQTGDLLLQEVARRLTACVRQADTVARLSGDEFVVMLENLSKVSEHAMAQARTVGEKILATIGRPHLFAGHEYHCTACLGITVFGDEPESAVDVLQRAEIAMFQAKEAGRNTMRFFAPALQAAVHARVELEQDLRQAIMSNQFVLYYQPQVERERIIALKP